MTVSEQKLSELIKELQNRFNVEKSNGIKANAQIVTNDTNRSLFVQIKDQICSVNIGETSNPDLIVQADEHVFLEIFSKQMNPMNAYMSGKLQFKGSIQRAIQLFSLFQ